VAKALSGVGIGLRTQHLMQVLRQQPQLDWIEVHICNYLRGAINRQRLNTLSEAYPLSFHGVSLNLGGVDPLNSEYLALLAAAVRDCQPALISDHAAITCHAGHSYHDLLPPPLTEAALDNMAARVSQVQETLGRQILLENLCRYVAHDYDEMPESAFYKELCRRSGCRLLLDLSNCYINSQNLNENGLLADIDDVPLALIGEVHLGGYREIAGVLKDTHDAPVSQDIWALYERHFQHLGNVPCLIEWDSNLPSLEILQEQAQRAKSLKELVSTCVEL
jgi:uncharacterized protein (UPF0276 family)